MEKRVAAVFAGAKSGNQPIFTKQARELGGLLASQGIHILWGGGDQEHTIMGELMRGVLDKNGKMTACILEKWHKPGKIFHENINVEIFKTEDARHCKFLSAYYFFALGSGLIKYTK